MGVHRKKILSWVFGVSNSVLDSAGLVLMLPLSVTTEITDSVTAITKLASSDRPISDSLIGAGHCIHFLYLHVICYGNHINFCVMTYTIHFLPGEEMNKYFSTNSVGEF